MLQALHGRDQRCQTRRSEVAFDYRGAVDGRTAVAPAAEKLVQGRRETFRRIRYFEELPQSLWQTTEAGARGNCEAATGENLNHLHVDAAAPLERVDGYRRPGVQRSYLYRVGDTPDSGVPPSFDVKRIGRGTGEHHCQRLGVEHSKYWEDSICKPRQSCQVVWRSQITDEHDVNVPLRGDRCLWWRV